ncbi:hypothetical protein H5410_056400 [Solanum commersonii]|uniref:Uncharacterized protein n=1 Tax=Solanum commersonii TaxID=4109 RepID=A0A9J5WL70_SOLCO|nr:hypothetical protein H5410_056400 [Solanum commersonii]
MLLQITYQDKVAQTEKENTIENILKAITILCTKLDSMDNEIQKLKPKAISQSHDYKHAEICRSKDTKHPELEGDIGILQKIHNDCFNAAADQLMIYSNSRELRQADMDEVQKWILSLLKPEEQPITRALKKGFISNELLTRYCKLIGHKYPDHICSKCNGEDNVILDV